MLFLEIFAVLAVVIRLEVLLSRFVSLVEQDTCATHLFPRPPLEILQRSERTQTHWWAKLFEKEEDSTGLHGLTGEF